MKANCEKSRDACNADGSTENSIQEKTITAAVNRQAENRGRNGDERGIPRLPHKLRLYQYLYDNISIPIKLGFRASQLTPDDAQYFYAVVQLAESAHGIKYGIKVESDWVKRKTGLNKSRQIKARHSLIKKGLLTDMGHERIRNGKDSVYIGVCLYPRGDV